MLGVTSPSGNLLLMETHQQFPPFFIRCNVWSSDFSRLTAGEAKQKLAERRIHWKLTKNRFAPLAVLPTAVGTPNFRII
ncbi:MAG TPA: hypothetical protein PKE69_20940 [Pyrinomonadaceae bacterium]|nr:hypothetical protein [Pyrinomonadaceae bacterium]